MYAYLEKCQVLSRTWVLSSWGKHAGQVVSVAHPLVEYSMLVSASSTMIRLAAPSVPTRSATSTASEIDVGNGKDFDIMIKYGLLCVLTP